MTTASIDETTTIGQHLLYELHQAPSAGAICEQPCDEDEPQFEEWMKIDFEPCGIDHVNTIPRDADGNIIGTPWEDVLESMYEDLSKHYGVDLRTL
jgi:hypothetical protein